MCSVTLTLWAVAVAERDAVAAAVNAAEKIAFAGVAAADDDDAAEKVAAEKVAAEKVAAEKVAA